MRMRLLMCGLAWLSWIAVCFGATTYYVDFAGGDDTAAGTSTGTAWKTIPGTRTTNNSGYLNAAWGAIATDNKIPTNTVIWLKGGTTHDGSVGGYVQVNTDYYTDGSGCYDSITFKRSTTWGTGPVTFDGYSFSNGIAILLSRVDGVTWDGNGSGGIIVRRGWMAGCQTKEKAAGSAKQSWIHYKDMRLETNALGVATDAAGAAVAGISVHRGDHILIEGCTFDGGQQYHQGVVLGEDDWEATDATVRDCTAYNLKGDALGTDDAGIGFKAYNSQCTWSNLVSFGNQKGFDVGQQGGELLDFNITNTIINCTVCSNYTGINAPGTSEAGYTGGIRLYLINSLIYSNQYHGYRSYGGPHQSYVVHCVFDNNGGSDANSYSGHVGYYPDSLTETDAMRLTIRNTVFRYGYHLTYLVFRIREATNNLTYDTDWNSYEQRTTEKFFKWSVNAGSDPYYPFAFGADGPGHATGLYYTTAGNPTNVIVSTGTGHLNCDAGSRGTGCDNTALAPLTVTYTLTNSYAGTNLSGMSWYLPVMGKDRRGETRVNWDIGAYEYIGAQHGHATRVNVRKLVKP